VVHDRNDIARHRTDGVTDRVIHEDVLQVHHDHDQCGLTASQIRVRMRPPAAADNALGEGFRDIESNSLIRRSPRHGSIRERCARLRLPQCWVDSGI
jgi:hypothetical protein